MINPSASITRIGEQIRDPKLYLKKIEPFLFADGYPIYPELQTLGDLQVMGKDKFLKKFPGVGKRQVNWLFKQLGALNA